MERGDLPLCGPYSVEEEEDKDGPSGALLRRLIFLRNQHVIQTEVSGHPHMETYGSRPFRVTSSLHRSAST